jgi:dipeptidyl aminopeptidase/acylaminoacyl peptidase
MTLEMSRLSLTWLQWKYGIPDSCSLHRHHCTTGGKSLRSSLILSIICVLIAPFTAAQRHILEPEDLYKLHSVTAVKFSPNGTYIAYVVTNDDGPQRPYTQLWVMDLRSGKSTRFSSEQQPSGDPVWSPDAQWLAYNGSVNGKRGLLIAHPDASGARFLAETHGTNSPEPGTGSTVSWSPDGTQIAFVSSEPGPETEAANRDPMVITRYLYKPDAEEGLAHFNDNRRLHIFILNVASGQIRQLTKGSGYEHSVDWSPNGNLILFAAEHGPDADRFFNYDLFTVDATSGATRQLTFTEGVEYHPVWSPDGKMIAYNATKRGLTDRETNMEDTHAWVMSADGSNRQEIGVVIDDRQGAPMWSPDGRSVYFTVQERGSTHLYRLPLGGGEQRKLTDDPGAVGSFSIRKDGAVAYSYSSVTDRAELYLKEGDGRPRKLTDLNASVLGSSQIAPTESFTFLSNDNKWTVETFLTRPVQFSPDKKYPLVVDIHGGPHGQNGPAFSFHNQAYAAHGYAVLMVNYRGSTGYGQSFADAVFRDQDGDEGMDVLYAVNAALRRYPWIDRDRLGIEGVSYGGQLTDWLITQTNVFKAAIPIAGITNFISYNYITYYNQYEAMEWGEYPHQDDLMNILWERSPLKHVAAVHTPTMILHGENDPDVPIEEAEQFYVALKDLGVETIFVRYPREGHGLREAHHQVDSINRAFQWYDRHFAGASMAPDASLP